MIQTAIEVLDRLERVLIQVAQDEYTKPCKHIENVSIGQHTRHIIEMFECLLTGYDEGVIDYDARQRDLLIEINLATAIEKIQHIKANITKSDKPLQLHQSFDGKSFLISTNYRRELLYNIEHSIHHEALIKVGLRSLTDISVDTSFGVAFSTLDYRKQCAQ
ncbi:MAG: DinB family protein [Aquaticitalea sp.]